MQPKYLSSATDLATAIVLGQTPESLVLDFKKALDQSPGWQKEICRDVAQFANTWGGCLVIGIAERLDPITNLKVAETIVNVPDPDGVREQIETSIQNHLVPSTTTHEIVQIRTASGAIVVAVNIPPNVSTVYVWDRGRHTIECLYRTNHGKAYMNPDEMERHAMNTSRARMLALKQVYEQVKQKQNPPIVDVVSRYYSGNIHGTGALTFWNPPGRVELGQIAERAFELSIPTGLAGSTVLSIPYELLKATCAAVDGSIVIMLDVRIVLRGGVLRLEPYDL